MRGGKRDGAGRKGEEGSVVMRVPVGLVERVREIIDDYRQGRLKTVTEIKVQELSPILKSVTEIKDTEEKASSKSVTEIKDDPRIREQVAKFSKLSTAKQRVLKKEHGTLYQAAFVEVKRIDEAQRNRPRLTAQAVAEWEKDFWSERGVEGDK